MKRMRTFVAVSALSCSVGWSAEWSDLGYPLVDSLAPEMRNYLRTGQGHEPYALLAWLNPYYQRADFNGDGYVDIAVLARDKGTDKRGILIVHGGTLQLFVLGAGTAIGSGGDDFSWMDAWYVHTRGPVGQSAHEDSAPPALVGDALMVIKTEAASGIIYWTGTAYEWYQQAD